MQVKIPTESVEQIKHADAGKIVRALRLKSGKTLRWLADQMKLSQPFISDLELGRRNWTKDRFDNAVGILNQATKNKLIKQ